MFLLEKQAYLILRQGSEKYQLEVKGIHKLNN
jgi:hypothetical protein